MIFFSCGVWFLVFGFAKSWDFCHRGHRGHREKKMCIFEKINKRYDDAIDVLVKNKHLTSNDYYNICTSALKLSKSYCESSLMLLENEHELPAMALLRIQAELGAKFTWIIEGKKKGEEEFTHRLDKWKHKTLQEWIRLQKDSVGIFPPDKKGDEEKKIKEKENCLKKLKDRTKGNMPNDRDLIQSMYGTDEKVLHGAGMYRQFHFAVHPDLRTILNENDECDITPNLKIHSFVNFIWTIKPIYEYFDLSLDDMTSEVVNMVKVN